MVNVQELSGRSLAVVLFTVDKDGEDQFASRAGTARYEDGGLHVDWPEGGVPFRIPDSAYERIARSNEVGKAETGCDYWVILSVKRWPDGKTIADADEQQSGMTVPEWWK